jgi:predicted NUDIX family phosphoesterase
MSEERVLVIARDRLPDAAAWYGLRTEGLTACLELIGREGRYQPRAAMEHDPSFKQVIPYIVLRDGDRYFLMRRTRAGVDQRLHDRWSIGVGGHLNPGDGDLHGGLLREWHEELEADFEPAFEPVALLNDDTTDVGSVHLGVVCVADARGRLVDVRERDKLRGSFASPQDVAAVADDLETWSRLIFEAMEAAPAAGGGPGPLDRSMR